MFAALSAVSVLAACEDKRVKAVDTGISRDSAVSILAHDMKPDAPPDSLPNVYSRAQYLISGKTYEVLYFDPSNKKAPPVNAVRGKTDTIPLRKLTPIVLLNNKVVGKGWDYWDSLATANKIALPPK